MAMSNTLNIKLKRIEDKFNAKGKFIIRKKEVIYLYCKADEIAENEDFIFLEYFIGKEEIFLEISIGLFYYVNNFYIISR